MEANSDPRNIACGREIPSELYCDQPYIVKTDDGAWLCVMTTGEGREGQSGQHVVTFRSTDQGRTWEDGVDVEPADGPEASYAVLLKVPTGRIYCFHNHNTDNMREVIADDPPFKGGKCKRVDSLGYFVFKYSDDHGRSWSANRYNIPFREFEIDRENVYGGKVRFGWNVGKPFIHDDAAYVSFHKVGGFGHGFFTSSEGALAKSVNILTESDPEKITWETLPEGDVGLRAPKGAGPVAEEQSYTALSDGSIHAIYRTVDGYPTCSYSRDNGRSWSEPRWASYADGRPIKHPRAANFAWRCENGKYLYWHHNHGGDAIGKQELTRRLGSAYDDRNPVWLSGGVEVDTPEGRVIQWSQPEIALYDDDPYIRMSYPDLIEEGGRYFVTETQKTVARIHELDSKLLEGLWNQFECAEVAREGLVVEHESADTKPNEVESPKLKPFVERDRSAENMCSRQLSNGLSVSMWLRLESLREGQVIIDNRTADGHGFCLRTTGHGTIEIVMNDGRTESQWACDPGMLEPGQLHHVAVNVDGGPKVISFVVDGKLCDGGRFRQFGWGRFNPNLRDVNGGPTLRVAPSLDGELKTLRVYDRCLSTSEAIGNWRAGS